MVLVRGMNQKKASNRPYKLGLDPNNKVDVPKSFACLNLTLIFGLYALRHGSKNGCQKDMLKKDWIICSKHDNHYRLKG